MSSSLSGIVLAGGPSRRMGRDKAFVRFGKATLLETQVLALQRAEAAEILISGRNDVDYGAAAFAVVHDEFLDAGPLGGILAGLRAMKHPRLYVLAVDLPWLPGALLKKLADHAPGGVFPRVKGRIEPLAAVYPSAAADVIADALGRNENRVQSVAATLIDQGLAVALDLPDAVAPLFANWNTPDDIAPVV